MRGMTTRQNHRQIVRTLYDAAVAAADPAAAVARGLETSPAPEAKPDGRTFLIAVGKAAPAMLGAAMKAFPESDTALAVTHHENQASLPGAEILHAGHPVPDEAGAEAAQRVIDLLETATADDRVIALISGGGSALLPAPPAGVSLADKAKLNALLLSGGLDIVQMNMVRQQVSELKGGGFLQKAAPAHVHAYLLSDVIGDDLRAIASGPTVSPIGTPGSAIDTLKRAGLWDAVPASIQSHLTQNASAPDKTVPSATNTLVGSNRLSLDAMVAKATKLGLQARIANDALEGDVNDAARDVMSHVTPVTTPTALIFGGETTVVLKGTGKGGRNQELALRVALNAPEAKANWTFLSGGTDGRDGPTVAAGGVVDAGTKARIAEGGADATALLNNNDSFAALQAADDLLITDATGTNVADVQVLLLAPQ